jgi:putative hydrolase of the HAD superfamily
VFAAVDPVAQFADFPRYFEALFGHYAAPAAWLIAEQARPTLTALRNQTIKTGVVSNFDHRLPAILDGLGLAALLDVVVRPADVGVAKPDAAIFLTALRQIGVEPDAALYVGDDDDDDVGGARRAGLQAINVATLPGLDTLLQVIA